MLKLFSKIKVEFSAMWAYAVVVGRDRELATQIADGIFIKIPGQFQDDGATLFVICEIPYTFAQDSIDNCPDLVLGAPYRIEISHSILFQVLL